MAAAEMTPSVVQKTYVPGHVTTGTPMKLVKYTFKTTKTTDGDWIDTTDSFQAGTPIFWNACTTDASADIVQECTAGIAYTHSGATATTYLTLSGGTTGTTYGEVWYED